MANNLYPLNFKPGIKRDGTLFQADYCTDGKWVRFQRGFIRKMGGMKGGIDTGDAFADVSNIALLPLPGNNNNMSSYIAGRNNGRGTIRYYQITQNFDQVGNAVQILGLNNQHTIWQSTVIIQNNAQKIVFLNSVSQDNINSNAACSLYAFTLPTTLLNFTNLPPSLIGLSGLLFTNPYLFVYGSNGLIQWSKPTDPLNFSGNGQNITISNDKVIFGASIRGGINTPTLIFWTLSSVVRCINTGQNDLAFQIDILSKSSSILSSRCVVEWDGLFFWPGTNRFFHFNGIVQELPNTLSLNYFFNNLDMSKRQQVFGVKNTQYGEIWWFYPEKTGAPNRNNLIPQGDNSRALIYNIRENSWYDTDIPRTGGVYSEDFGFMTTYGRLLTNPGQQRFTLYRHEYETFNNSDEAIMEVPVINQIPPTPIPSTFTTPTISWAAFNPMKQLTGVNRWMEVVTMEPDFTLMPANTDMEVVINSKQYAQDFGVTSPSFQIPAPLAINVNPMNAKIDIAVQGRHISFTFSTTFNFEMGQTMLLLGIGDGQ